LDVLTAHPSSQQLCDADVFGTSVDEMMLSEFLKKKATLIKRVEWKASDDVGTILYSTNVGPLANFPITFAPTGQAISLLDNVSSKFAFWSGGLKYITEIVCTPFHEGKLDFNYHPAIAATTSTTYSPAESVTQYSLSHLLRNSNGLITNTLPFLGDTPYKKVWRGQDLTDKFVSGTPELRFTDYFSGSYDIRVSSRLNAPETVSPSVELMIYIMGAEDYTLAMNTLTGSSIQHVSESVASFVAHSKTESTAQQSNKTPDRNTPFHTYPSNALCASDGLWTDVRNTHFGEKFESLRDLAKKYQRAHRLNTVVDPSLLTGLVLEGTKPLLFPVPIMSFRSLGGTPRVSNYNSWLASMFRLFRGSMSFKARLRTHLTPIAVGTPQWPIEARAYITPMESQPKNILDFNTGFLFPSDETPLTQGPPLSLGYCSNNQTAEFKVPFMSNRTAVLNSHPYDIDSTGFLSEDFLSQSLIFAIYFEGLPDTTVLASYKLSITLEVDEALGDEAMFGLYCGMPRAYIQNSPASAYLSMGPDQWAIAPPAQQGGINIRRR
jgi:hypothetical protein